MDVSVVVQEVEGGTKLLGGTHDDYFAANATVTVENRKLIGYGEHTDQVAAEALALADLKAAYRVAFPPKRIVVSKTVAVDFS